MVSVTLNMQENNGFTGILIYIHEQKYVIKLCLLLCYIMLVCRVDWLKTQKT